MLILPYQTQFSLARLPYATLALIAACVFVFLGLQGTDEARYRDAITAYNGSPLPALELPRYRTWLARSDSTEAQRRLQLLQNNPASALLVMQSDAGFLAELAAGRIVTPDEPQYARWRADRARIQAMLDRVFTSRFSATPDGEWWRLLSYQFLHGGLGHLVGNMLVLLVAGPFVEAALGRWRFLAGYLLSGAAAGAAQLALAAQPLVGASGAIAGTMAMMAVLYGLRRVRVFYWVFVYFNTARVPALALLPLWVANEAFQWYAGGAGSRVAYAAHLAGFGSGAVIAWLLRRRDPAAVDAAMEAEFAGERKAAQQSSLLAQARDAAARLDTRRAARLYGELVDLYPDDVEHLIAYFNVAVLAQTEALDDALLRVLWFRDKSKMADLRKIYLQMGQTKLLGMLPVDEQLRLARRLVSAREDAAALKVLDRILEDANLRTLYGRQTADCLLGLFTAYTRYGLKQQAASVQARLAEYFPKPAQIGGLAPQAEPPATIRRGHTRPATLSDSGPQTIYLDLS